MITSPLQIELQPIPKTLHIFNIPLAKRVFNNNLYMIINLKFTVVSKSCWELPKFINFLMDGWMDDINN
jgi:hypothetical protein